MKYNPILLRMASVVGLKEEDCCPNIKCSVCPSQKLPNYGNCQERMATLQLDEFIAALEKWDKEHPQKTYAMDFYEKFPHGYTHSGVPEVCVRRTNELFKCPHGYMDDRCRQCFHEHPEEHAACWNTPMPEEATK